MTTHQPAWKESLRGDAEAYLRSQPTDLVWVPCMFCGEDTLTEHKLFTIEQARLGRCTLGAVCDDYTESRLSHPHASPTRS